jgi:hypothetical protein
MTYASLLDLLTQLVKAASKAGNAVIVIATDSRRDSLSSTIAGPRCGGRLAAIERGRYLGIHREGHA